MKKELVQARVIIYGLEPYNCKFVAKWLNKLARDIVVENRKKLNGKGQGYSKRFTAKLYK